MLIRSALSLFIAATLCSCASKPKPAGGDPDVKNAVRSVVEKHIRELRKCYEQTIDRRPGAEGKVVVRWSILPDGQTADARVLEKDKRLEGIDECLLLEIGSWKFAEREDTVDVERYPFFFSENGRITEEN